MLLTTTSSKNIQAMELFNEDGSEHHCKKQQQELTNGHNEISLDLVLKKLAKIGVQIYLERLKNV
jgi:hypothetical protein